MALRDTLDRVVGYDLMGAPIGAGAAFAVADAMAQAFAELVEGYIKVPPIVTGIGLSIVDRRWVRSERWLGDRLSALINMALCKRGIDSQFKLTEKVSEWMSKILPKGGAVSGLESVSYSVGEISGSNLGQMESLGEVSAPVGQIGVKAADILSLRKKRLEAYK